jgi:predicted alpha/beta hydrolase family esterase
MTKNVLFIHSAGEQSATEGSGLLVAALRAGLAADTRLAAPIMPKPDAPDAAAWEAALREHISQQQAPLVLVGHSLGGSVIFKLLADHGMPAGLAGVVSIAAPFWGMADWSQQEWTLPRGFEARLAQLPRVALYHSRDDEIVPVSHVDRYAEALPNAQVHKVDGRGHFFGDGNVADILRDIAEAFEAHASVRQNSNA